MKANSKPQTPNPNRDRAECACDICAEPLPESATTLAEWINAQPPERVAEALSLNLAALN